jgi:hypothetical protein
LVSPIGLEAINDLLIVKEESKIIDKMRRRITTPINEFVINYDQICFNILWTSKQTLLNQNNKIEEKQVSENQILKIKIKSVKISKKIKIGCFIFDFTEYNNT